MKPPDEIDRIMAEAMAEKAGMAATPDIEWPNGLPMKWPAYIPLVEAARAALKAAGFAIVLDEAQLLEKGGEVKLHD